MNIKNLFILCLLTLFAGCGKDEVEELVEPEPIVIYYSGPEGGGSGDDNNNNEGEKDDKGIPIEQNILINGGLEKWESISSYDMPEHWLCHNNNNVRKDCTTVYEGKWSAKMKSLESGSTATIDQCVQITPDHTIRIRFRYYVEQWKDKGARTYCYFRTRSAEVSTIPTDELKAFYDESTYRIIRGGGSGLAYLPHELNVWHTFDETILVPPTANYFVFGVNSYYGTTIYIDDCYIVDVTERAQREL